MSRHCDPGQHHSEGKKFTVSFFPVASGTFLHYQGDSAQIPVLLLAGRGSYFPTNVLSEPACGILSSTAFQFLRDYAFFDCIHGITLLSCTSFHRLLLIIEGVTG